MFKFIAVVVLALIACVAAKPGLVAYSSPYVAAAPAAAVYSSEYHGNFASPYVAAPYYAASPYYAAAPYTAAYTAAAAPVLLRK